MDRWASATRGFILLAIMVLLAGILCCGYRFTPGGETIGRDVKTIYVAVFTNNTSEAYIETLFRNAFVDQFIKGRRFTVVNREEDADALLTGDVKNLLTTSLSYRKDNLAVEKRITVVLSLTLKKKEGGSILWKEGNFSQWEDASLTEQSIQAGQKSLQDALFKLANDTAERAYRIMVTDF